MITKRKKRRQRTQDLVLFILETEKQMCYQDLADLIGNAVHRVSRHNLAHLCKPLLDDGTIIANRGWSNGEYFYHWKLSNTA